MRFTKSAWDGIADGSLTVAFRWWQRPTVVAGRPYRTGGGRIQVDEIATVTPDDIDDIDAQRAGFDSLDEARESVAAMITAVDNPSERQLYRVRFHRLDEPDPRTELANDDHLTAADVEAISGRLDRFDAASSWGAWTRPTLELIAAHPGRRAPDLAAMVGRDTKAFKLDVRKLKNLGLTVSLRVGYELSPRGRAYLFAGAR